MKLMAVEPAIEIEAIVLLGPEVITLTEENMV